MATVTGIGFSPELALLTQFFVLGSAVGTLFGLLRFRQTGRLDEWPVHVAYWALALFALAGLILFVDAVFLSQ